MAVNTKRYLDYAGLKVYDEKIKALIKSIDEKVGDVSSVTTDTIHNLAQALAYEIERAKTADEGFEAKLGADESAGTVLGRLHALEQGDAGMTEDEVNNLINTAIAALVNGAPDTFDTLKEISDWISKDEEGTAQLVSDVAQNKTDIAGLRPYIDAQDTAYFNAIGSIELSELDALFKEKVELAQGQSIQDALNGLTENQALTLTSNSVVTDNVVIPSKATVLANGTTFSGTVTVANDALVQDAVFTGKVTVA